MVNMPALLLSCRLAVGPGGSLDIGVERGGDGADDEAGGEIAAQAQMPIQHVQPNRDEFDDDLDGEREDFESGAAVGEVQVPAINHGAGPQPVIEGMPAEVALNAESGRESRDGNGQGRHRDRRHQNGRRSEFGQNGPRDEQQAKQDGGSHDNVGHDNAVQDSAPQDQGGHD